MKIIRTIKITNEQFYDYLEQQLIEDIKNSQHKKISASDFYCSYYFHVFIIA